MQLKKMLELNRLYNMDCMQGMAGFPDKFFDLAIVDPPYFAEANLHSHNGSGVSSTGVKRRDYHKTDKWDIPTTAYYEELLRVSKEQIIFGINYFAFSGVPPGRIVWDKQRAGLVDSFSDGEIASCSLIKSVRIFRYRWDGMLQGNMKDKERKFHVTQKPVALYSWILERYAKPGERILDTHAGSASSLIACHRHGARFIGFEIDEGYYRLADERLRTEMAQLRLEDMRTSVAPEFVQDTI
jgi:site-specific DNA-methyltransferase (adenine-specific)